MFQTVVAAHERRFRELDPLLPTIHPLPEVGTDQVPMVVDGGVGFMRRIRTDPGALAAAWAALDERLLIARVDGVAAMAALLRRWRERVAADVPADEDSSVGLNWPSRDTAMTRTFVDCGLLPQRRLAVRPAGRPTPDRAPAGVRIRPLSPGDVDDAVDLHLEEIRWGEQFGGAALRPDVALAARQVYVEALADSQPWVWIAERDQRPLGMIAVTPPDRAGWVQPLTSASGPAYVSKMVVVPGLRGAGVGAALVRHAHAALDEAGVAVTLLHYNAFNPLSVPFWHRSGYRPLWTNWERTPVSRFLAAG